MCVLRPFWLAERHLAVMNSSVVASVIPDGQGGRMIAVACDDEKDSVFRETVEAARSIEDFSHFELWHKPKIRFLIMMRCIHEACLYLSFKPVRVLVQQGRSGHGLPSQEWIAFQQKIPPTGPVRERVASINSLVPRNP